MASAHSPDSVAPPAVPVVVLSALTFLAGAGGMTVSLLFLASPAHFDVLAGAVGFVAGAILGATGLLSLGVQSRSPATSQAARGRHDGSRQAAWRGSSRERRIRLWSMN